MKKAITFLVLLLLYPIISTVCFAQPPDAMFFGEKVIDLSAVKKLPHEEIISITVLSVPSSNEGVLFCEGVALERFDTLQPDELDSMIFLPNTQNSVSRLRLLFITNSLRQQSVSLTLCSGSPQSVACADISAPLYVWAWAQNNYFSAVSKLCA